MTELRLKFLAIYAIAVASAYFLKRGTLKTATKAIEERKLTTGLYRFFPIEGDQAVRLARGYINGSKIYFWFIVLLFPLGFFLAYYFDAI